MAVIINNWKPSLRNVTYEPKPEWVPQEIYDEAVTAKRQYNAGWEFYVWQISKDYNCSMALAEEACLRGLKKAFYRNRLIYGDAIGKWFEDYLDMGDTVMRVKSPDYVAKLGD